MKKQCDNVTAVVETIRTIDEYYDYSFKIRNQRCYPLISQLIQQLENLFSYIDIQRKTEIQATLLKIIEAMNSNDYVKIRDLLYYELKKLLQKLIDNQE